MAGVTTAARMSLGPIAATEVLNPKGIGEIITYGRGSGQYRISGLNVVAMQNYHDMEIWFKSSNQSTWTTNWGFYFESAGQTSMSSYMSSSYYYSGYSGGTSQGTNNQGSYYNYPSGYSSYGHMFKLYISNVGSSSNIKSWHGYGGYTNGSATSYVTCHQGGGSLTSSNPIDSIYISNGYGNGSTSYQAFTVFGRRPK